ncbi:DUF6283 family protein [Sciscionella marina]|uniref:DUF6283 family protein n=1 Tax=Sciscionella marina TaxID=508770 RepID=UPI00037DE26A
MFLCHLTDQNTTRRSCAGWAGCHDGDELLALRVAVIEDRISGETARQVAEYRSPVPLFASGAEAAVHGLRDIEQPGADTLRSIAKIKRVRPDLEFDP